MNEVKVSIIIPVYNVQDYLEKCLDSALFQSIEGIEVIAVNDGSTDNSIDILRKYSSNFTNIIILDQNNKGQSAARNLAIKVARGKYIYFLDSDDFIDSSLCEICYSEAESNDLDLIAFDAETIYDNESVKNEFPFTYSRKNKLRSTIKKGEDFFCDTVNKNAYYCSPCLVFFKRSILLENNISFYEGIIHEDELFMPLLLLNAKNVKYLPLSLFYRRVRNDSTMTKKRSIKNVIGYYSVSKELYAYINDMNVSFKHETIKAINRKIESFLITINLICWENWKNKSFIQLQNQINKEFSTFLRNRRILIRMSIKVPYFYKISSRIKRIFD